MKPQEYLMNEMFDKRCALGISQEEMASRMEISLRQYSNIENGRSLCSIATLAKFLEYCDVNKNEFFSGFVKAMKKSK